jgi:hypothetical protein
MKTENLGAGKGKRLAIIQSSYIPWKGYFDIINSVDEFVLLDDVQFTRRDWRNRNKIKSPQGIQWLTIPVASKGNYHQAIDQMEISTPWADRHRRSLELNYRRAPHFGEMAPEIFALYQTASQQSRLSRINRLFIEGISRLLGIGTPLKWSRDYQVEGSKTDRLLSICVAAGADRYLSGPSARVYLDVQKFASAGIAVEWMDYQGYPVYPQLYGPFEHGVSIVDLLFNTGKAAPQYMRSFRR